MDLTIVFRQIAEILLNATITITLGYVIIAICAILWHIYKDR